MAVNLVSGVKSDFSNSDCNNKLLYFVACSVSGLDKPNPALRLATRAGKMALPCPLGITCCVP